MGVIEHIGRYKRDHHITILQPNRWREIQQKQLKNGQKNGLSAKFIAKYLEALHQESIRHQTAIMNK
jgi:chorismate mutase